jgi:hypothetical protein
MAAQLRKLKYYCGMDGTIVLIEGKEYIIVLPSTFPRVIRIGKLLKPFARCDERNGISSDFPSRRLTM